MANMDAVLKEAFLLGFENAAKNAEWLSTDPIIKMMTGDQALRILSAVLRSTKADMEKPSTQDNGEKT